MNESRATWLFLLGITIIGMLGVLAFGSVLSKDSDTTELKDGTVVYSRIDGKRGVLQVRWHTGFQFTHVRFGNGGSDSTSYREGQWAISPVTT